MQEKVFKIQVHIDKGRLEGNGDFKTPRVIGEGSSIGISSLDPQIWGNHFSNFAQASKQPGAFGRDSKKPRDAETILKSDNINPQLIFIIKETKIA